MKTILTYVIISFFGIQILYSQEKDTKITYKEGEAYFIYQDAKTLKIINKVPFAKVRNIYYDTFYKMYIFLLSTPEGATSFTLKFVRKNKMFPDEKIMIDSNNKYEWSVNDHLEKLGKLWVIGLKEKDGVLQTIYFENVTK
jgi:hypothetical protein